MNGDSGDDDMALLSLLEKHPFNLAQIKLILKLEQSMLLVKTAEHINGDQEVNGDYSNDKANDDDLGASVGSMGSIKLSSLSDHPSVNWIESNLSLVRPLSDYLTAALESHADIFESIAELTARRGSPSSSLKIFYHSVRDSSNATRVDAEILLKGLYQIALASHVVQHWNIWNNDDYGKHNKRAEQGTSTSMDHLKNVKMCAMQTKGPMEMIYSLQRFQQEQQQQPETNDDNQNNDGIECHAFLNWVEIHFPHMNSILSTFIHLALFSTLESPHPQEIMQDEEADQSTMHLYALGKRIMFQFPALSEFILATANSSSPSKDHDDGHDHKHGYTSQLRVVGQMPAQSFFLPDREYNGGTISYLAFALSLMDTNISGKWHKLVSTRTRNTTVHFNS